MLPELWDEQSRVAELEQSLAEANERVRKLTCAASHWKKQYEQTKAQLPLPTPPAQQQQQRMDDERPPKRVHESPYKASQSDGPLSPSSYAQVAAAGTSTESPQLVQPKKTRSANN